MDNIKPTKTQENFPITPAFVRSEKRAFIEALYAFCRTIDNTADAPDLDIKQKQEIIGRLTGDLQRQQSDHPQLQSLLVFMQYHGVATEPLGRLLQGLGRDITLKTYRSWSDLYLSAQYTAAPIGEMFLMAYKESLELRDMVISLCIAMQVANHLQDIKRDYETLGRLYIPQHWFSQQEVPLDALTRKKSTPSLKTIYRQTTIKIFDLLQQAQPLLKRVEDNELRRIVKMAYYLTARLTKKLQHVDILKKRPTLSRMDYALAYWRSAL